ncbi:hypothetical protein Tco_0938026 [Tanacetum coccineum]|uniref:Uncharacterized protein n=1 Tax=Tanacetum coccineum TaxID=301880 RepID=A0ABQ5DIQ2_9ASTR
MWLIVVSDEEATVNPEILHTRYPIVDWESQSLGSEHVYKIINTSYHKTFESMLKRFDRQDLVDLHGLVMKRFKDNTPEGYNLILLGDLNASLNQIQKMKLEQHQDWTLSQLEKLPVDQYKNELSVVLQQCQCNDTSCLQGRMSKEKGKGIMTEPEPPKKLKKRVQVQLTIDEELAKKLYEEEHARFNAEQEARAKEEQGQEKSDFELDTIKRYQELKRKPISVAQARKNMMIYLKNMAGYKMEYFKGMSYDDIRPMFEVEYNKVQTLFKNKDVEEEKGQKVLEEFAKKTKTEQGVKEISKKTRGMRRKSLAKKRTRETQDEDTSKRQKHDEEETTDYEEEELRLNLKIVPNEDDEVYYEPLSKKYPIVYFEYQLMERMEAKYMDVYKLTIADGSSSYHGSMQAFLRRLDRQDLDNLYSLVQERFRDHPLEGHDLMLWGDLRMIFEPDENNEIWKNQFDWKALS